MKQWIKIVAYVLLVGAMVYFFQQAHLHYGLLQEAGTQLPTEEGPRLGSTEEYRHVMTWGALGLGAAIAFALLFARDFSHFFADRAMKFLNLDESMGIKDTEYEQADEAARNGKHLDAIRLLREYLAKHPREIHALVRIAEIYDKDLRNYTAAALEYERVLEYTINPERWGWIAIRLVNIYTGELGETEKGVALLRRIVGDYGQTKAAEKARQRLKLYEEAGAQVRETERIMGVFSKLVAPDVVDELLGAESLNFGGERKRLTILFADIRGFTGMTDDTRAQALAYIEQHGLNEEQAKAHMDHTARETLATVNIYLSTIADMVKKHHGTLDKYMGDCVMAFWGAPAETAHHALFAVWAAIEAQQAIQQLNQKRQEENERREHDNRHRERQGLPPLPPLPVLSLGIGINTGEVIVGLMGSEAHILNYTVFGREVNVAARLEGIAGSGRVIIGQGTYEDLRHDSAELASKCDALDPVTVKGIKEPVPVYSVPWEDLELESAPA
jgi:class 3 adenylate cyclase